MQYGAEAIIGHIGDAASKLPSETRDAMREGPWKAIVGARIMVDHVHHRLHHRRLWLTLVEDLPQLREAIERHRAAE
ncbi:MAG TPA: HepT-like ribonuclease domain-containing protein [Actinomycetes bacterium]|nr:HepT-like ribonuclease domain-containing protein [Actinomycetes bacterium]